MLRLLKNLCSVRVRAHEIGLLFHEGDFVKTLGPGRHWFVAGLFRPDWAVETVDTHETKFEHADLELLLQSDELRSKLHVLELSDTQRAIVWVDGRLADIVGSGRTAYWKAPKDVEVDVYDISDVELTHANMDAIVNHVGGRALLASHRVEPHECALIYCERRLMGQRGPGLHVFWRHAGNIVIKRVDLRLQSTDVTGQDIMTSDKVTLRVNMVVSFRVVDPEKALTVVSDASQSLYREAQLALRETVGARTLDGLLTEKEAVGREVRETLASIASEFGVEVRSVGLRDVILPGDMKTILNQVIEAQKQAEANMIRRREETAAARSQVNTAKLFAEHPALARMKEMESLQESLRGAKTTFVLGQGDLVKQVGQMVRQEESP